MKRYILGGCRGDAEMEEDEVGEYVKYADVVEFVIDVERGNCTMCHLQKGTGGGLLCLPCRMNACFRTS